MAAEEAVVAAGASMAGAAAEAAMAALAIRDTSRTEEVRTSCACCSKLMLFHVQDPVAGEVWCRG